MVSPKYCRAKEPLDPHMRAILQSVQPDFVDQPAMVPRFSPAASGRTFRTFIVGPNDNLPPPQQILKCRQADRYCQDFKRGDLPAHDSKNHVAPQLTCDPPVIP